MKTLEVVDVPAFAQIESEGITLGKLVAKDIRNAEVFKRHGLDFCCGGKKSLKQACEEIDLDIAIIEKELHAATQTQSSKASFDFNRWGLDFLADYIFNEHHQYWYDEEPVISDLLKKVVNHHGATHPELRKLDTLFATIQQALNVHFAKEEQIIFPHIKNLVEAKKTSTPLKQDVINDIEGPLQMMEAEHEAAGDLLEQVRRITNNYTPPADACNSFTLLYHKLSALEEDLHQHIHLENNILFVKAAKLEKELKDVCL